MNVNDLFSIKGQVALVTGGAGLYGRQLVAGLAEAGCRTYIASRSLDANEKLAASYREQGYQVSALQYDQSNEVSIVAMRDTILERENSIDILINNSVLRPMRGGYHDDAEHFAKSMDVNATGLFTITRAIGDAIADTGGGSIIMIGSIHGMIAPDPFLYEGTTLNGWYPDYFFHKGGMLNYTQFVASYYGDKGVRCNCVSPGGYQTESHDPQFLENYAKHTMLGRMANDDDLKGVVVFLASRASGYMTGANVVVDAGYTAR